MLILMNFQSWVKPNYFIITLIISGKYSLMLYNHAERWAKILNFSAKYKEGNNSPSSNIKIQTGINPTTTQTENFTCCGRAPAI